MVALTISPDTRSRIVHVPGLHATIVPLMGIDHEKLTTATAGAITV